MSKKCENLKLTIELVPAPLWGQSLYNKLNKVDWARLKRTILAKEGKQCFTCGHIGTSFPDTLYLHEFWEYDDTLHVQKLASVHHLCDLCHKIKHVGRTLFTDDGLKELKERGLTEKDIIAHFCTVNKCKNGDFDNCLDEALRVQEERNEYGWNQDIPKEYYQ